VLPAALVGPGHHGGAADPATDGSYTARLGDIRSLDVLSLSREAFTLELGPNNCAASAGSTAVD